MSEAATTVWIFHGEDARFASGVFRSRDEGMAWIAEHRFTGVLTEYPLGIGAYDDAVARGLFRPSRESHGTPSHIARFSPGRTEHIHVVDGQIA